MSSIITSFPDQTYTTSNKPSVETLKADISALETGHNDLETTAVKLTGTQSVTGQKTFSKPIFNASVQGTEDYSPAAAGTATLDLSLGNIHKITMPAGNITIALTNASVGQVFKVDITQDSGGSRTVTWFSTIRWAGGSAPTLTTTGSKRDSFIFECTGSGTYDGFVVGFNI